MSDEESEDTAEFFTTRHEKMTWIANVANALVWVVFIGFALAAVGGFFGSININNSYRIGAGQSEIDFKNLWRDYPVYAFELLAEAVSKLLNGVVFALVLKGVSLGLNMIVEIDLNGRERMTREGAK